jgi:hypothetical protein
MHSFLQFITMVEARHFAPGVNGDWGFITNKGELKSGLEGPHTTHNALARSLKLGKTDHQAVERGHARYFVMHPEHNPQYSVQSPDGMQIETSHKHAHKVIPHAINLMRKNKVKPNNVLYHVQNHDNKDKYGEPEHEVLSHREFMDRYKKEAA